MKKQVSYSLILLTHAHLLLFVFPLAVKTLHKHHFKKENYCYTHESAKAHFVQQIEDCPICEYELLSFVTEEPLSLDIHCFDYPVSVHSLPKKVHLTTILRFSLRAPPLV